MRALIALHRIGPYHDCRFAALANHINLHVVETRPYSEEYPWQYEPKQNYPIYKLKGHLQPEDDPPRKLLKQQLEDIIDVIQPNVIVTVGWNDQSYQTLLFLANLSNIPVLLVSDSRASDEPRSIFKEWIKSILIKGFASALVAGEESRSYLQKLSFPSDAIFQPWDVVNNEYFSANLFEHELRKQHFLCVSRLVPKKNHIGLLDAFSKYQYQGGNWGLHIVGSGPLESEIFNQISQLPHPNKVKIYPFCQLDELRRHYAEASVFILPSITDQWGLVVNEAIASGLPCIVSNTCGCTIDLIHHLSSGWVFSPSDSHELTSLLFIAEQQTPSERKSMTENASKRLNRYSIQAFCNGITKAMDYSLIHPRTSLRATALSLLLTYCL